MGAATSVAKVWRSRSARKDRRSRKLHPRPLPSRSRALLTPNVPATRWTVANGSRKLSQCTWVGQNKEGLCIDNGAEPPVDCSKGKNGSKCKALEGCSWNKKQKKCLAD